MLAKTLPVPTSGALSIQRTPREGVATASVFLGYSDFADMLAGIEFVFQLAYRAQCQIARKNVANGKGKRTAEQQRIHELETENRRLRMEKEILKKATAFFAKESS